MDRYISKTDAREAGWRRILSAQRELRTGHVDQAVAGIEATDADFPDLGHESRLDLTLRAASMLTRENQAGRARQILLAALAHSSGHSDEDVDALLDQLREAASGGESFPAILSRLAADASLPLIARLVVRERQVDELLEADHAEDAETLLREALATEKTEYARFRVAERLAEVLTEDREDQAGAVKLLDDLLPGLKRSDLANRVRAVIKLLQVPNEAAKD
jgi:hypothetical protein